MISTLEDFLQRRFLKFHRDLKARLNSNNPSESAIVQIAALYQVDRRSMCEACNFVYESRTSAPI